MIDGRTFEYTAVAINVVGSVFVAHRNRLGYKLFIAGFLPSAAFAVYYRHWGLLSLYIYYLAVNCYGLYLWRKADVDNR